MSLLNKPNITDYRTVQIFKLFWDGIIKERYSSLIPDGVKNEIHDVTDADGNVIGDYEFGDDGFLEIMVMTSEGILKIKRYGNDNYTAVIHFGKLDISPATINKLIKTKVLK